jgi:hypothetical protein
LQAATHLVLGEPELGNDLAGIEVAAETLVAGRAETAADSAACLRRDAQRGAVRLKTGSGRTQACSGSRSRNDPARSDMAAKSAVPFW